MLSQHALQVVSQHALQQVSGGVCSWGGWSKGGCLVRGVGPGGCLLWGGGVPAPGDVETSPESRRLLLRTVCILLHCILV